MRVSDVRIVTAGADVELRAEVHSATLDQPLVLWYRAPAAYRAFLDAERGDPFVPALLLAAMRVGEPLQVQAPVSAKLLAATDQLQTIYRAWDRTLAPTVIEAPVAEPGRAPAVERPSVGLFFSLGVDSFYSLLRNVQDHPDDEHTIRHLLVVRGFGFPVDRGGQVVLDEILTKSGDVAEALGGKVIIPIATNIRSIMDRGGDWSRFNHGAGMTSVGLALGGGFRRLHIGAGPTYANPTAPCGSHPLLDPLWSTEDLTFRYDGGELWRAEKLEFVVQSPIARETLRVCRRPGLRTYNCGRCSKCLTTMMLLDTIGVLGQCRILPSEIDPSWLEEAKPSKRGELAFCREVLDWMRVTGRHPALVGVYEERLERAMARRDGRLDAYERERLGRAQGQREIAALRGEVAALRGAQATLEERHVALGAELRNLRRRNAELRRKLAGERADNQRASTALLRRMANGARPIRVGARRLLHLSSSKLGRPAG